MKVLIVDDEKHVRNAINMLADWERYGITEVLQASDGEAAVSVIQAQAPQIVMTDMRMPRKDGAELLTWLYTNAPQIKVMVISGYDDFELVRHAVRHGGMDYILKPVQAAALNEALGKAVDCWRKEEHERQRFTRQSIEVNEMKPHYGDKLFTDFLVGQGRLDQLLNQLRDEFKLPANTANCSLAVLAVAQLDRKLLAKFQNQLDLLFFTLINICNEFLKQKGVSFRQLNSPGEVVILFWDERSSLPPLLDDINEGIYMTLHRRMHIGVSLRRAFPAELTQAYQEASQAVWRRSVLDPKHLHTYTEDSSGSARPLRLSSFEEQLRLAALSGNREQIENMAARWLDEVKQLQTVTPEQLIQWDNEWDWMQSQWLEGETGGNTRKEQDNVYPDLPSPLPLNEEGLLSCEPYRIQLVNRLAATSKLLTQQHSKETSFFVHDIAKYIERHYQEEISLQDVAARFFLSREYIARKFKQEYGVTLLDYLSRFRIEKAKLLLHNSHLRIAQVAEMVGYQDEKYFSKVFKKLEGINPGEFRKEHTLG